MDKLISMLDDEHVDVALPQTNSRNEYNKLDKEQVKLQLKTRKDLEEVQTELLDKNHDERKKWVLEHKNEANTLFKSKNFQESLKVYLRALMGIGGIESTPEQASEMEQIKFTILCNMAIAAAEMCSPKKSISLLNQAIKISETAKVNYLFATNYFKLQEYELAVQYIDKAWEMVQEANDAEKMELYRETRAKIHKTHQDQLRKERQTYKNIFGKDISVKKAVIDAPRIEQKGLCHRLREFISAKLFWKSKTQ